MINEIKKRAKAINKKLNVKILFLEGNDPRIQKAAKIINNEKIAIPVLLKKRDIKSRLNQSVHLLNKGKADAVISGATHSTVLTLKLAFNFIKKNVNRINGAFLMILPDRKKEKVLFFADCAAQPEPSSKELAEIALLSAKTFKLITRKKPRAALLSYSTHGSGKGLGPEKVKQAIRIIKKKNPKLTVEGEIQADAALVPAVALRKSPKAKIKGNANVLIFPCLDSANIGYKLVEYLGKWQALGPILQGLDKQVNDLSRGCSVDDIINLAAITVLQVAEQKEKKIK